MLGDASLMKNFVSFIQSFPQYLVRMRASKRPSIHKKRYSVILNQDNYFIAASFNGLVHSSTMDMHKTKSSKYHQKLSSRFTGFKWYHAVDCEALEGKIIG